MSSNLQVRATKGDGYEALAGYFGNLRRPSRRGKQRRGSSYPWCAHLGTGFESTNCGFTIPVPRITASAIAPAAWPMGAYRGRMNERLATAPKLSDALAHGTAAFRRSASAPVEVGGLSGAVQIGPRVRLSYQRRPISRDGIGKLCGQFLHRLAAFSCRV